MVYVVCDASDVRKMSMFVSVVVDGYGVVLNQESGQETTLCCLPQHDSVLPTRYAHPLLDLQHAIALRTCYAHPLLDLPHEIASRETKSWTNPQRHPDT